MVAIALPLLPALGPGAAAFSAAAGAYITQGFYNFRRGDGGLIGGAIETGEATLAEKVADYLAGANVAAGFPEPPPLFNPALLGPVSPELLERLGQGGSELLAQFWSFLNSRPETINPQGPNPPALAGLGGTLPPEGNTSPGTLTLTIGAGTESTYTTPDCVNFQTSNFFPATSLTFSNVIKAAIIWSPGSCGPFSISLEYYVASAPNLRQVLGLKSATLGIRQYRPLTTNWTGPNPYTYVAPSGEPFPLPDGFTKGEINTEAPATLSQIAPAGAPLPLGTQIPVATTAINDNTGSSTGAAAANASTGLVAGSLPALPALPAYLPAIGTPLGTQTGTLPQTQPAAVPITPATAVLIGTTLFDGATAATSLVAIGQEVLRIEKKLEAIMQPGATPDIPWLDLLSQIANAISILSSANTYTMVEVCPPDGQPPEEYEWEVPGVPVIGLGLAARLDALAEMLQVHKNLKQPVCRTVPQGQPVQVQFIQSETEWETPP